MLISSSRSSNTNRIHPSRKVNQQGVLIWFIKKHNIPLGRPTRAKQTSSFAAQLKPITVVQPDGPGFNIQGHKISSTITDCPPNAVFMDGYYANQEQQPLKIPNIKEVRPGISFVVRMVSTVGNYDYRLGVQEEWFIQSLGLSGILEGKPTTFTHTKQIHEQEVYGTLLANNIIGVRHDHFITFHFDLDIDGHENSFSNAKMIKRTDVGTPRKSYWSVVREAMSTELEARTLVGEQAEFLIVNPNRTKLGTGYFLGCG
ncbi:Copper amine oxidase, catalytic domain [Dillenia turbinata]|uniref:Amine oxidase n=1 Tax=Dillenia turbinata TaxID=194707 RepID=A0AAN8ZDQ4_9MAGN